MDAKKLDQKRKKLERLKNAFKNAAAQAEKLKDVRDELITALDDARDQLDEKTRQLEATSRDLQAQTAAADEAATAAAQREEVARVAIEKGKTTLDQLRQQAETLMNTNDDSRTALTKSSQENATLGGRVSDLEKQLRESEAKMTLMIDEHGTAADSLRNSLQTVKEANEECQGERKKLTDEKVRLEEDVALFNQMIDEAAEDIADVDDDEELQRSSTLKF